jgi:hypothetical protein
MELVKALGHADLVMHHMRRTALDIFKRAGLKRENASGGRNH